MTDGGGVADSGVTDGGVTDGGVTDGGVTDGGAAGGGVTGGAGAGPLLAPDLLVGAQELAGRLGRTLEHGQWLDAYLLAAGLSQLVEDRLHPDPLLLYRAASYLGGLPSRPARAAGRACGVAGAVARARPGQGRAELLRARHALDGLTARLACQVLASAGAARQARPEGSVVPHPAPPLAETTHAAARQPSQARAGQARAGQARAAPDAERRAMAGTGLAEILPAVPFLAGDVLRIPACFHGFDQHPDDVLWLAGEFGRRYPLQGVPLCVVGVRTSGSYLAPLYAAALRAAGHTRVSVLTYRPGRPFLGWERDRLAATAKAGGFALITDDPPGTGTSMATAARAVVRFGFGDPGVVLVFSSFGDDDDVPRPLSRWPTVVQPWARWSIHRRLAAEPVKRALAALVGPGVEVAEVRPAQPVPAGERGHIRARFDALISAPGGDATWRDILVEGAGLGYLGRQAVAVADALPGYLPRVYGFADGLLYRDWLPAPALVPAATGQAGTGPAGTGPAGTGPAGTGPAGTGPAGTGPAGTGLAGTGPQGSGPTEQADRWPTPGDPAPGSAPGLASTVTRYVTARRRALPAPDSTGRLHGRDPAWEVAARLLSGQFGPLAIPARPLLLEPLVRRLLRGGDGAVLDGKTDARHWLPDPADDGDLRKVDFYQRGFGHLDLTCYDPVFDLAGAAADPPSHGFEAALREEYRRATGDQVDGERWLLYRLAQLWRLGKAADLTRDEVRQRSAAAVGDYLAGVYLRDLPPATGPLCAIDLDGVLECDRLGYPVTSPTGMLALRALLAHSYRPVLASGRSIPDIAQRCATFGLAGGVAEYGTAIWVDGEVTDLRPRPARTLLERARAELSACPGAAVDPAYRYAVRVRATRDSGASNGAQGSGSGSAPGSAASGPAGSSASNGRAGSGPLSPALTGRIPVLADPGLLVIHGLGQTDVAAACVDKGTGLSALAERLAEPGFALAVGDAPPDLPMFALASLARAPRNARPWAGASGITVTRHAYQSGLVEACAALLGHRPGRCRTCRAPAAAPRTRALLAVLDLRADGLATIPSRTLAAAALSLSPGRW